MSDDKPGHILTIPDSLGRDLDRAKEGKIAPPPMEAFMSDAALAEVEKATRARSELIPAESLIPITRGQANAATAFDGQHLPRAPQTRRVKPAPFRRPRIEAGKHGKRWQWVPAPDVIKDDIVPDVGLVTEIHEQVVYATREHVLQGVAHSHPTLDPGEDNVAVSSVIMLHGKGGQLKAFRTEQLVQVFRKSE